MGKPHCSTKELDRWIAKAKDWLRKYIEIEEKWKNKSRRRPQC